jgi:hypothetical protein
MSGGFKNRREYSDELSPEEFLWVQSGTAGVLLLIEQDTSPDPTDGFGKLYVKTDKKLYYLDGDGVEIEVGSGSAQTIETPTGTVDDSNVDFIFTKKPFQIVINHMLYRENSGWVWSVDTATLVFPVGTGGDIYGIMQ